MSIDSLGGPDGADAALQARRRRLEEERSRELDRVEKRRKEEVAAADEAREKALADIYANNADTIADKQRSADDKVERVKAAADARVRQLEADSNRMTDEARRQFQAKANLLSKNAQELDQQRQYMLKQHNDSMKKLKDDREQRAYESQLRANQELAKAEAARDRKLMNFQQAEENELDQMRTNYRERKQSEIRETTRALEKAQEDRDEKLGSIQRQVDFYKRTGDQELETARGKFEANQVNQQIQFENRLSDMRREARHSIAQAHTRGANTLSEVEDGYRTQLREKDKNFKSKARQIQATETKVLQNLENQEKMNELLAKRDFGIKKKLLDDRQEQILDERTVRNQTLKEKVDMEYAAESKKLIDSRQQRLLENNAQVTQEMKFQADRGKKQVDELVKKSATELAAHETRKDDPFYQLHRVNAKLDDEGTHYVVSVTVPEHEQDSVRLTNHNGQFTLSGARRSQSTVRDEDGRHSTSSSYQSYTESFPAANRVDMSRMTREYANGQLTFRVPKFA
jgi:HSP20 family molecular chaperone IbpA